MSDNLDIALLCITIGASMGIPFAVLLPRLPSQGRKRYANILMWTIFLFGLLLCTVKSVEHFLRGMPYWGGFFAAYGALSFSVLLFSGFRALTHEQERTVD